MIVTVQPAQIVNLPDPISLEFVRDNQVDTITAKVRGLPRQIVLWHGVTEYASASAWNNSTALAQASAVLALSSIPWA